MKNQYIIITVTTIIFICSTFSSPAQLQAPRISLPRVPSVFDNTPPPSLPAAPIDGGLSLLITAGAGYGIKKLKGRKNKQEENK